MTIEEIKQIAQNDQVSAMRMMIEDAEPRLKAEGWEKYEDEEDFHFSRHNVILYPDVSRNRCDFGECYWVSVPPLWIDKFMPSLTLCAYADTPEASLEKLESLLRQDFEQILAGLFGPKTTNNKENENE